MKIRKLSSIVSALLTATVISGVLPCQAYAASSARSSISDGTYAFKLNDNSSLCVNVIYASKQEDKAQIGVDNYNGESNEKFKVVHRGNNYYSIHPTHAENLCVNALLGNRTPGDKVTLHRYEANDNCSLWSFHKNSNGSYTVKNKHTGLVWDITNGNYTIGNRMINWTSNDYLRAQGYRLEKLSTSSSASTTSSRASISDGTYAIKLNDSSSLCVNVIYASKQEDKAQLGVDNYNGESNEKFKVVHRGNNYYSIHPTHAENLCVNALLGNKNPGDKVTLHRYEANDNCSLWSFHKNSNGSYTIKNKHTGLVWDITNGDYSIGSRMINWTSNGFLRAQGYRLEKLSSSSSASSSYSSLINVIGGGSMTNALYGINTTASKISCGFDGYRNTKGRHEGIDFTYSYGKNVYSLTDGVITNVKFGKEGSSGLSTIAIYNKATNKTVIYLHSAPLSSLYIGKSIAKGERIATESWRGCSKKSGSHTHVEVRNGKVTNAAKSVNDSRLDNSNPTSFWKGLGYTVK